MGQVVGIVETRQRAVTGRVLLLIVAGIALYVVFPSLVEVLEAWPRLADIAPGWFALMLAAEVTSFAAVWYLQRIAFRDAGWFDLVTSQLASNAFSRIVPGGAAAGGARQFRMSGCCCPDEMHMRSASVP